MVQIMGGVKETGKLKTIPLSNNIIKRRISYMVEDISAQVIEDIKNCIFFSLKTDKSTDISNFAQFIVLIRYHKKCLFDTF